MKEGERIELSDYFEGMGAGESGEVTVYYRAGEGYLPLRICARRKSGEEEEQGRKRLEKTNRKKGCGRQEACNRYIVTATSLEGVAVRIPDKAGNRASIQTVKIAVSL
jgi:hypothetical protein